VVKQLYLIIGKFGVCVSVRLEADSQERERINCNSGRAALVWRGKFACDKFCCVWLRLVDFHYAAESKKEPHLNQCCLCVELSEHFSSSHKVSDWNFYDFYDVKRLRQSTCSM